MTDAFRRCLFFGFLLIIVAFALFAGWSRSRSVTSLREENRTLREQLETTATRQSELDDLQALRDHLRRSIDAFALENESLRNENTALRERTNQLSQLQLALAKSKIKAQHLQQKVLKLQGELDAKPSVPRLGAWLGAGIRDLDQKLDPLPDRAGVIVVDVTAGRAAARGGLYAGDRLFSVDGEVVVDTQHFKQILAQKAVGRPLALQLSRNDSILNLTVIPDAWPQ